MSTSFYTRPNRFPPIVKNLIIINVLVWLAQIVFHNDFQLTSKLALYPIDSQDFEPYQIATHMFAHSAVQVYSDGSWAPVFYHIFFNMFNLFVFGSMLENVWGSKRFLIFYLVCGVGAAAVHLLVQHLQFDASLVQQANYLYYQGREAEAVNLYRSMDFLRPAVGASGAVMGIMAGAAMLFPNTRFMLMFIPVPIKLKYLILGLVAIDLFGGINPSSNTGIAHFAHLGGALTGFIMVLIWNKTNRRTLY